MSSGPVFAQNRVFLNIPYDDKRFGRMYVAYIVGVLHFNLLPVVTLQIASGRTRVDRIYDLLRTCRFSIHDLSWVRSCGSPRLPRFNMPFELGMAFAFAQNKPSEHTWIAFDSERYRAQKVLSDLSGSDFNIHEDTPEGIMRGLCSVFVAKGSPSVPSMMATYDVIWNALPRMKRNSASLSLFEARIFNEIVQATRDALVPEQDQDVHQ